MRKYLEVIELFQELHGGGGGGGGEVLAYLHSYFSRTEGPNPPKSATDDVIVCHAAHSFKLKGPVCFQLYPQHLRGRCLPDHYP